MQDAIRLENLKPKNVLKVALLLDENLRKQILAYQNSNQLSNRT